MPQVSLVLRCLLLALASPCVAAATPASAERATTTLVVDRDRAQCPNALYPSIQQAVDAARPGDAVKVCADRYPEQVTIDKPLTLHGENPTADAPEFETGATAAGDCFEPSAIDPTLHAIVDPNDGTFTVAFRLRADDIVLQGFVVQGASVGIDASDSYSGYRIDHNLIQNNTLFGIDLGSSGAHPTRVHHNCIRDNRWGLVSELDDDSNYPLPPVGTDPEPYARELFNARIHHNETTGNTIGLEAAGPGRQADVTLAHNRSHRDGSGLAVGRIADSAIMHNEITDTTELRGGFGAIMIDPGSEDLLVAHNRVIGGTMSGIAFTGGLQVGARPSRDVLIVANEIRRMQGAIVLLAPYMLVDSAFVANTVAGNRGSGITLNSGARNTLTHNTAIANGSSGIFLGATTSGYDVHDNVSDSNGRNGIAAGLGATGHRFVRNSMHGNGSQNPLAFFDANDANFLLNTWISNDCVTDNPPGAICGQ